MPMSMSIDTATIDAALVGVETSAVPWDQTHFHAISRPWRDLGYAVIPSDGPRSKTPLAGDTWRQYCGEGRVPVPDHVYMEWCSRYADHEGLLLGDSSTGGLPDLAIVDADHPSVFAWVVETFGPTPLTVESGRPEGGRHHYYRVRAGARVAQRNGQIGPRESFVWVSDPDDPRKGRWKAPIDVKSSRSYVCVAGTTHKTGLVYRASAPITREIIFALPELDDALYLELARTCKPARPDGAGGKAAPTQVGTSHPGTSKYPSGGTYDRERRSGSAVIPGPGLLAGKSLDEAAAALGAGGKMECGCPFHPSVSGRSATLRVLDDGSWRLSCHVDAVTYEPQGLQRLTIEEADAVEDKLVPPSVEVVASRLLRDRRYSDVLELAERQASPSPELYATIFEALAGLAGDEGEEARDGALKSAYEVRIQAKREAAASLDPRLVVAAKRATALAAEFVGPIRAKLEAEGLVRRPGAPDCGVALGLQNAKTGVLRGQRLVCKGDSCPGCGPVRIAQRVAAALVMPVTGMDGLVSGTPLTEREVWAYELEAIDFETWKKRWRRQETSCPFFAKSISRIGAKAKKGHRDLGHAFVALHRGQKVLAISTLEISGLTGEHLTDPDVIRRRVIEAGTACYRAIPADLEDGLDLDEVVVVGKISSSHGLSLDPARLVQIATTSAWVSLGPVKISALKAEMEARKIEVKAEEEVAPDGGTVVKSVGSTAFVAPKVAAEITAAASSRREVSSREDRLARAPPLPDLDDIIVDLGDDDVTTIAA